MSGLKNYTIDLVVLKNQDYTFHYTVDDTFFEKFPNSILEKGEFEVVLKLSKSETMIQLFFDIQGTATLLCDRSLEEFQYPLHVEKKLILQYGSHEEEITEELEIIPRNTASLNVARFIYEHIGLAIPLKKLHPRFDSEEDEEESFFVYSSDDTDPVEPDEATDQEEEVDPRWQKLKNLKNK